MIYQNCQTNQKAPLLTVTSLLQQSIDMSSWHLESSDHLVVISHSNLRQCRKGAYGKKLLGGLELFCPIHGLDQYLCNVYSSFLIYEKELIFDMSCEN